MTFLLAQKIKEERLEGKKNLSLNWRRRSGCLRVFRGRSRILSTRSGLQDCRTQGKRSNEGTYLLLILNFFLDFGWRGWWLVKLLKGRGLDIYTDIHRRLGLCSAAPSCFLLPTFRFPFPLGVSFSRSQSDFFPATPDFPLARGVPCSSFSLASSHC